MAQAAERPGVVRDPKTGELIIPASQRPDGSWRKPRRVKDGYIPQEEVPTFQTKGSQFRDNKPDYPIGLCKEDIEKMKKAKEAQIEASTNAAIRAKNVKPKEKGKDKRQKDSGKSKHGSDSVLKGLSDLEIAPKPKDNANKEIINKIKTLKKKLREVKELEEKIALGDIQPSKQQTEKVQRKQALMDEIEELESKAKP